MSTLDEVTTCTSDTVDEDDLRREVAHLLRKGPRQGVAELCAQHRSRGAVSPSMSLDYLVRVLCAHGSVWISEFKKRACGKKRCSPALRKLFRDGLEAEPADIGPGLRLTPEDVLRRLRKSNSAATITVANPFELGIGRESDRLFSTLHRIRSRQDLPVDLRIEFDCDHLYIHGLGILAAWCDRYASNVVLATSSDRVSDYLDATGLRNVFESKVSLEPIGWDAYNHVALTSIDREQKDRADKIASRIADLFERHISISSEIREVLTVVFAELVENVYRHSQSSYGAFVIAQAYPTAHRLHITVADSGIGILGSFQDSCARERMQVPRTEREALEVAMDKFITSKADQAGYGLFIVRRLIEENGGSLRLTSGTTSVEIGSRLKLFGRHVQTRDVRTHSPWNGTEVSLMFRLDGDFPIRDIYAECGPAAGTEDYFS